MEVRIRRPDQEELERLGVPDWPVWEHGEAVFPWTYEATETCYILEGEAVVTPEGGAPVVIRAGDLVVFPRGMSCTWEIRRPIRKHYSFGG